MNLASLPISSFNGLQIIRDNNMVDISEDWSNVRSLGRAKRRRNKHKQRIIVTYTPKPTVLMTATKIIGHTTTINKMLKRVDEENVQRGIFR